MSIHFVNDSALHPETKTSCGLPATTHYPDGPSGGLILLVTGRLMKATCRQCITIECRKRKQRIRERVNVKQ